jgi:hypothetical protein
MNDDFASDGRKVESLGFVCEIYTTIYVMRGKTGRNISFALGVDGSVRKIRTHESNIRTITMIIDVLL